MNAAELFHGPNAAYVAELYDRYLRDPASVDEATRELFNSLDSAIPSPSRSIAPSAECDVHKIVMAARVARLVRELGHLAAHIDPLGSPPPGDPGLELETHGITATDLASLPATVVGGPLAEGVPNALEAIGRLRKAYSGSVGYEDDHIQVDEERQWLRDAVETARFFQDFDKGYKREVLQRLTEVETLERYLDITYNKKKRFSIEGLDMLVPMLDQIIDHSVEAGTREIVVGMAHRGRLNVLAHVLNKPYHQILSEFEHHTGQERPSEEGAGTEGYTGDVKYHLGARYTYTADGLKGVPITLCPNPSHLEYVNPVVMGRARAAQEACDEPGRPKRDFKASLAISIHGDAAFPGQGIVAETLNLSQLSGYRVGGTIHIITNNQIGFTTSPGDGRSTLYASDLAKGFEIPIVHANADDVPACIAVAKMAIAYREKFAKDFLIDLVGYRRWGHNEGDEPSFTQPRMYEIIRHHPTVREIWAQEMEREGSITRDEAAAMVTAVREVLQQARKQEQPAGAPSVFAEPDLNGYERPPSTAVPADELISLNQQLLQRPDGFTTNAKLDRGMQERQQTIHEPGGIEWGHAESLAFASILADGTPIRLTGQDVERGTFSHRHIVLHDPITGERYFPLQRIPAARASFAIYNSPLSENACLGFEYGYSMHATGALVLWEAQFGDFANSAQVIVDQFLISGNAKWQQTPSLGLLLPHGYEGAGPEHSSARIERFLQLAANGNIRVVNCTTPGQYFHVLRRQAQLLQSEPRPLIVITPKSLLRYPPRNGEKFRLMQRAGATTSLNDIATGTFRPVIDDPTAATRRERISRLVLCSGKVFVDLIADPRIERAENLAVARLEQIYPFPEVEMQSLVDEYPNLRELVWLQEEPRNMGAWNFVAPYLRETVDRGMLRYEGRPESASPAEGVEDQHVAEQVRLVSAVLENVPVIRPRKIGVAHGR